MLRYTLPTYYTAISLLLPRFIPILMLTLSLSPRYFCVSLFSSRHVYSGILISFLVPLLLSSLCTLFSLYIALFLYLCLSLSHPSSNSFQAVTYVIILLCAALHTGTVRVLCRSENPTSRFAVHIVTLLHPLALLLLY